MKKIICTLITATLCFAQISFFSAESIHDYGMADIRSGNNSNSVSQVTSMATEIISKEDYESVLISAPSHAIYTLNKDLNIVDKNGSIITDIHNAIIHLENKVVPTFRIETIEVAQAFCMFEKSVILTDAAVISTDVDIINFIRQNTSFVIGIIDFSQNDYGETLSPDEMMQIRGIVNKNLSKIVVLPTRYINKDTVEYLQKKLITVWTNKSNCQTQTEAMEVLTTGTNGVLTQNCKVFDDALIKCTARNSCLRRSYVIGHRGNPATYCENTVEGSMIAFNAGADIIENDIYISKDGVLFVMHDEDISRTTNGTGLISEMTYNELRSFTMNGTENTPIPTLEEYFQAFDGLDVQLFVEIKGGEADIIDELVKLIDKYSFLDQISVISFNGTQLNRLYQALPEISLGFLCNTDSGSTLGKTKTALTYTKNYNSTYNTSYSNVDTRFYQQLNYRGITSWPWTFNEFYSIPTQTSYGAAGITTNGASYCAKFPASVEPTSYIETATVGMEYMPKAVLTTFDGSTISNSDYIKKYSSGYSYVIILDGEDNVTIKDKTIIAPKKTGTFTYVIAQRCSLSEKMQESSQYYTIYTSPITVTVSCKSGDLNADGDITLSDAMLLFTHIAGKTVICEEQEKIADINNDSNISLVDAIKLFMIVAGKS